jgi:protein tyrosine phosphatase
MESKPDLSNYLVEGAYTNDKTYPDISWNMLNKYGKDYVSMEDGIPIQKFWDGVKKRNLQQDYSCINQLTYNKEHDMLQPEFNHGKDRYSNILTYNHRTVVLKNEKGYENQNEYINANWIDGCTHDRKKIYIATQGPL